MSGAGRRASVSVVVAVHNGAAYLAEAIASAQNQTRAPAEIIVVDDGSTDTTAQVMASCDGVVAVHQARAGPSAARNRGIAVARGDYIAPLDADDRWPPDRLEVLGAHLDSHAEVGVVLGHQRLVIEPGAALPAWVPDQADPETLAPTALPLPTCAFLARRSLFDAVGGFAEDLDHGEDTDWVLRVKESGAEVAVVPAVVLERRLHQTNLTGDRDRQHQAMFAVLARRIRRHRTRTP